MHARLDELLSLRDGAPVGAASRAHVQDCAACAAELAKAVDLRARLQALPPAPAPDRDGWAGVQARLRTAAGPQRPATRIAPYAAAASMAALAVFASLRWLDAPAPATRDPAPLVVAEAASLDELRARSQALEELLAALPQRPAVERAGTSVPIESLEAQVQWLDHQLTLAGAEGRAPDAEQLWRDRVELMSSLVQLRFVEAQQVNL